MARQKYMVVHGPENSWIDVFSSRSPWDYERDADGEMLGGMFWEDARDTLVGHYRQVLTYWKDMTEPQYDAAFGHISGEIGDRRWVLTWLGETPHVSACLLGHPGAQTFDEARAGILPRLYERIAYWTARTEDEDFPPFENGEAEVAASC